MLGERLKKQRKAKNISQAELANILGMTRQGYSHYETGRNEPDLNTLMRIAQQLECSTDYLLGNKEKPSSPAVTAEAPADYIENLYKEIKKDSDTLSFVQEYLSANPEQRQQIRDFMRFILVQKKNS